MPLGETDMQAERWWVGKVSPRLHGGGHTGGPFTRRLAPEAGRFGQIEDGRIHALRQAEIVAEAVGVGRSVPTGLGTEAGRSAPDRAFSSVGVNTSTRVGAWSR